MASNKGYWRNLLKEKYEALGTLWDVHIWLLDYYGWDESTASLSRIINGGAFSKEFSKFIADERYRWCFEVDTREEYSTLISIMRGLWHGDPDDFSNKEITKMIVDGTIILINTEDDV